MGAIQPPIMARQAVALVGDHVELVVEGLQKPDNHRGHKDNGKGAGDEILGFVINQPPYAFGAGEPVVWAAP